MNKLLVTFTAVAALCIGAAQARDLDLLEGAYEASLGEVVMPRSIAGTTAVRPCSSCPTVGLPVNGSTVFQVSGQSLALADFLLAVDDIHDREGGSSALVAVYYAIDTNTVTRINVLPPGR